MTNALFAVISYYIMYEKYAFSLFYERAYFFVLQHMS